MADQWDESSRVGKDFDKPQSWPHDQFRDRVIQAVQSHDIPTSELPNRIDLTGPIGNLCDRVNEETLMDPEKRERYAYGKINIEGKMLLSKNINVGEAKAVSPNDKLFIQYNLLEPQYNKQDYRAIDIHSHGVADVPPSPADFVGVLMDSEDYGSQASIVTTPTTRFLVVRTNGTPHRSPEEAHAESTQRGEKAERERLVQK